MLSVELTKEEFERLKDTKIVPVIIKDKYYITHDEAANCGFDWVTKLPLKDIKS
jgi:hypothetical protein